MMNSLIHLGWLANELAKDLPVPIPNPAPSPRTEVQIHRVIVGYSHGCWEAEPH